MVQLKMIRLPGALSIGYNLKISHRGAEDTESTEMNENEIGTIIVDTAVYLHKNY